MDNLMGILNIYKEKDYTSHDVVAVVRKTLGYVKAGHTGTLDPAAEGVLPICIGKATKIAEYLSAETKGYQAVLNLGFTTDTDDDTGTVLEQRLVTATEEEIIATIKSFQKEYWQTPPMYSAIKVDGKRLYELARAGQVVERKQRQVSIYEIKILEYLSAHKVSMHILCSKGTYIRSLCADIGNSLGCGGNMGELVRTRSGNFYVKDSITLGELKLLVENKRLAEKLISVEDALPAWKRLTIKEHGEKYLKNGNKLSGNYLDGLGKTLLLSDLKNDEKVLIYDSKHVLAGIYIVTVEGDSVVLKPSTMLL